MSKRQRDQKRRKYRAWCMLWFGKPYDPLPQNHGGPRFGDGRTPRFSWGASFSVVEMHPEVGEDSVLAQ